jgi:DNA-binding IclR family transcriptional regulator
MVMSTKVQNNNSAGYQAPAVHKAFQLLRTVAESKELLGLTELALRLGYSKSTTHGLVHALIREGALVQDPDGRKLFIGSAVANLAFASWNYLKLTDAAQPIINRVRDQIKETVFLGALINRRIMIIAAAEADEPLKISASAGTSMPIFSGAVGKVFLAKEPTEKVMALIGERGLPRYTSRSIVDEKAYLNELDLVRDRGYALDDEEYLSGVRAVAVALNNLIGPPMAAWVVGLTSTMGLQKIPKAVDVTIASAIALRQAFDGRLAKEL